MIPDDGFDYCCSKPVYDLCVILWPWENPDNSHELIAIGEHICITPPVIPQEEK